VAQTIDTATARGFRTRISFTPLSTALVAASGWVASTALGVINTETAYRHNRFFLSFTFSITAATVSNLRFFCGSAVSAVWNTDPTLASSALGDRIGIAISETTNNMVAQFIINRSSSNHLLTPAATIVDGRLYRLTIYTKPLSADVRMELWEKSTASATFVLVASETSSAAIFSVSGLRPACAIFNGATAAASGTLHFSDMHLRMT
jgi:hypothetical protein